MAISDDQFRTPPATPDGAHPQSQPAAAASEEGEPLRPCCRICYGMDNDCDEGPLFRPCLCRGTMAWVHMECLDRWRHTSVNPRSFYRCDQCHFEYRLGRVFEAFPSPDRFLVARLLGMRFAVHVLSLIGLFGLIFLGGFFAKMFRSDLTWWDVVHCFNLGHLLYGSIFTGLSSFVGFLVSSLGWGIPRILPDIGIGWGGSVNTDDKIGTVIVAILVIIGLCIALTWIFGVIERYADRTARHARRMVLDAHHLHIPRTARDAADYVHAD